MKLYLCVPYSHPSQAVRIARFEQANEAAAKFMQGGHIVFSPISHSHPISYYLDNANDSDFWLTQDRAFLEWCDEMVILCIKGWAESKGIQREVKWAKELGKPIRLY